VVETIRSGSQQGEEELAAPPGSDWCGDKERSQGGEKGTLSGGESTASPELQRRKHEQSSFRASEEGRVNVPVLSLLRGFPRSASMCEIDGVAERA
jgi:hypothetical protein